MLEFILCAIKKTDAIVANNFRKTCFFHQILFWRLRSRILQFVSFVFKIVGMFANSFGQTWFFHQILFWCLRMLRFILFAIKEALVSNNFRQTWFFSSAY
uniref:Uncharacterized protein n=1 Tax=Cacopsylla melanoneura TaxID=428564 RepID=A0A8D9FDA8_9HEMI